MKRNDDIATRGASLMHLSDEELSLRFWEVTKQLVDPLLDLATTHTSPSIERSVAMRMGASSIESTRLVYLGQTQGILSYGIGHFLYFVSKQDGKSLRTVIEACQDESTFNTYSATFKEAMK